MSKRDQNAPSQVRARAKYEASPKGKASIWRRTKRSNEKRFRPAGPAGSPGPIGAAAQRERRARPEYRLARDLGVSVKTAREILSVQQGS